MKNFLSFCISGNARVPFLQLLSPEIYWDFSSWNSLDIELCKILVSKVFNHKFFFEGINPKEGGGLPYGELEKYIARDFGSFESFRSQFVEASKSLFGSGWVWLSGTDPFKNVVS